MNSFVVTFHSMLFFRRGSLLPAALCRGCDSVLFKTANRPDPSAYLKVNFPVHHCSELELLKFSFLPDLEENKHPSVALSVQTETSMLLMRTGKQEGTGEEGRLPGPLAHCVMYQKNESGRNL